MKTIKTIAGLKPDKRNANRGTKRGAEVLGYSITNLGTGRSILADSEGNVIAGNKTLEAAKRAGIKGVRVVQTDGTELIVVQRTDLNLTTDDKAKALALADNRAGQVGLDWDPAVLAELDKEIELDPMFSDVELDVLLGEAVEVNDAEAEWQGMPEFTAEDVSGARHIVVHFKTEEDAQDFAARLGQKITEKTKSMWHPAVPNADMSALAYKPKE